MKGYLNIFIVESKTYADKYICGYNMAHAEELFKEEYNEQPTYIALIDTHAVVEIKE